MNVNSLRRVAAFATTLIFLAACSGAPSGRVMPPAAGGTQQTSRNTHVPLNLRGREYLSECSSSPLALATSRMNADCNGATVPMPDYAVVGTGGRIVDRDGHAMLFDATAHVWLHHAGHRVITHAAYLARQTQTCETAALSGQRATRDVGCDDPADPPPGSIMGGDGNWYNGYGQQLGYCDSCNGGSGGWVPIIGSTEASPAYDPSLQPYVTAGQFADAIQPWFYAFAMPIDIPIGALVGRVGGNLLARIGARALGAYITKLIGAVGADNAVRISADVLNSMLGVSEPAFLPGSEAIQFTVTDGFNGTFQGSDTLVRLISDGGNQTGSWWTTLDQITNADGSLMSSSQLKDLFALPNAPSQVVYGGTVQTGETAYMGIAAGNSWGSGGGLQFWLPPNSMTTIGTARLGP